MEQVCHFEPYIAHDLCSGLEVNKENDLFMLNANEPEILFSIETIIHDEVVLLRTADSAICPQARFKCCDAFRPVIIFQSYREIFLGKTSAKQ